VHVPVVVQSANRGRLDVTPLVLSQSPRPPTELIEVGGSLDLVRVPPTVSRTFRPSGQLALFARVFPPRGRTALATLTLTAPDGQRSEVALTRVPLELPAGAADYTARVPLEGLAPGRYILELTVREAERNRPPVLRSVAFDVR
jgi:hypothetical protein